MQGWELNPLRPGYEPGELPSFSPAIRSFEVHRRCDTEIRATAHDGRPENSVFDSVPRRTISGGESACQQVILISRGKNRDFLTFASAFHLDGFDLLWVSDIPLFLFGGQMLLVGQPIGA